MKHQKLESPDPIPPDPSRPSRVRTLLLIGTAGVTLTACATSPHANGTRLGELRDGISLDNVWIAGSSHRPLDARPWCIGQDLASRTLNEPERTSADRAATNRILAWLVSGGPEHVGSALDESGHDDAVFPPFIEEDSIARAAASWFDASLTAAAIGRPGPFGFSPTSSLISETTRTAHRPRMAARGGLISSRAVSVVPAVRTAPGPDAGIAPAPGKATLTAMPAETPAFKSLVYLSAGLFLLAVLLVPLGCSVGSRRVCPQPRGPPQGDASGRSGGEDRAACPAGTPMLLNRRRPAPDAAAPSRRARPPRSCRPSRRLS